MAKAQVKEEEKEILQFIQNCPDFEFSEKELRALSSEFVTRFFRTYFINLKKECALMFGEDLGYFEDVMHYCPADVDPNDFLYVHIKDMLAKIGIQYISLLDILKPQNRTRTAIKIAVNFLIYVKQIPHRLDILHEILTGSKALEEVSIASGVLKEDIGKISELVGIEKGKLEAANLKYERELVVEQELRESDEDVEINKLLHEIEALEDDEWHEVLCLENLEKQEVTLQDKVVTEDEYKLLTDRVAALSASVQEIDKATGELDAILNDKLKNKDYLHSISSLLLSVDFNSWSSIDKIEELRQAIDMMEKLHNPANVLKQHTAINKMEDQLKQLSNVLISEQKSHESFCHSHEQKYSLLQKDHQAECERQDKLIVKYTDAREDYKKCKEQCTPIEDEIKEIIEFNSEMYEHFLNNYSTIATTFDRHVTQLCKTNL